MPSSLASERKKSSGLNGGSAGHSLTKRTGLTGNSYGVESPVMRRTKTPRVRGLPSVALMKYTSSYIREVLYCVDDHGSVVIVMTISYVPDVSPYFISKFFSIYRGLSLPTGLPVVVSALHSVGCAMVKAPVKAAAALDRNWARDAVVRGLPGRMACASVQHEQVKASTRIFF